ncbi:MAG: hypothetical protein M0R28_21025 [Pigmentiphaga sp.]|nr:hypothetical protein [Pigmentiphaga sp.]
MKEEYTVGAPMPRSIGLCADLYSEVRELRLAMQKHTDAVKERETEIREYIINNLSKSDDTGAAGKRYRAQIVRKVVPSVTDWTKLWDYVKKTGRFDLLQKRVSDTAVKDSWETGNEIPGVDRFHAVEVSITKL